MMINLREIHKPKTLEQALALLKQPGTVVLGGGTDLLSARRKDVQAVIDLTELGLAYIRTQAGSTVIGATTTLADAADSQVLRTAANGAVSQAAHRSAASILRNQATVVGTLIAEPAGILATVLVALEATLTLYSAFFVEELPSPGGTTGVGMTVADFLSRRAEFSQGAIVTEVMIPAAAVKRHAVVETVARTPRDAPIVSVCAALELEDGLVRAAVIGAGGVGETAVRAMEAEKRLIGQRLSDESVANAAGIATEGLEPRSEPSSRSSGTPFASRASFKGSAEYRREMVKVLTGRALRNLVR